MTYAAAVIVIATLVAMTSGKVGPVLALLVALIAAGVLGTAPADELFAGLSNPGVITVAGMLVIAKGRRDRRRLAPDLGAALGDENRSAGIQAPRRAPGSRSEKVKLVWTLAGSFAIVCVGAGD